MSAGLHPADSLTHLNRDSGIPLDSIGSAIALARSGLRYDPVGMSVGLGHSTKQLILLRFETGVARLQRVHANGQQDQN
jgi:hypothetical protein